jgi:hypothetical protein
MRRQRKLGAGKYMYFGAYAGEAADDASDV